MRRTFKKSVASLMAIASLVVSAASLNVNAADNIDFGTPTGYVNFGNGAKAGINRISTAVFLSTDAGNSTSTVTVKLTSAGYTTIEDTEEVGRTHAGVGYVSRTYKGTGFSYAEGYHVAGSASQSTYR